ncbi:MAG: hypothetical protein K6D96_06080 [Acetatifactor sp.]|nr:hypothetical protein [Acetatifactor sp.]
MNDVKKAFQLMKYTVRFKSNGVTLLLFFTVGAFIEFITNGTNFLGGFYFVMVGMFLAQMVIMLTVADLVQVSPYKKAFQVKVPVLCNLATELVMYTLYLVVHSIFLKPDQPEVFLSQMLVAIVVGLLIVATNFFLAICYKYYWLGFIIFFPCVMAVSVGGSTMEHMIRIGSFPDLKLTYGASILIGYVCILLGSVINYVIANALYKKPLDKISYKNALQKINK